MLKESSSLVYSPFAVGSQVSGSINSHLGIYCNAWLDFFILTHVYPLVGDQQIFLVISLICAGPFEILINWYCYD